VSSVQSLPLQEEYISSLLHFTLLGFLIFSASCIAASVRWNAFIEVSLFDVLLFADRACVVGCSSIVCLRYCASDIVEAIRARATEIDITPQKLRQWFCSEMLRLGVSETYVDVFCGRVPKSVLARHYIDFSPQKLEEIYEKANIKILS